MITKGQIVQYLFDTGAFGLQSIYGKQVTLVTNPELIAIAKKDLGI